MGNDGFWSVIYRGDLRGGIGMLVLSAGAVVGADYMGTSYTGSYTYDRHVEAFDVDMTMAFPAGVRFSVTSPVLERPYVVPIRVRVPDRAGAVTPVEVVLEDLHIEVELKKVAPAAA